MTAYYKHVSDGYVANLQTISNASAEGNITEREYNAILDLIRSTPSAPEGYVYRLREDLEWELCEVAEIPDEPCEVYSEDALMEMTNAELIEILAEMGISATMNKTNVVRLILAAQEAIE